MSCTAHAHCTNRGCCLLDQLHLDPWYPVITISQMKPVQCMKANRVYVRKICTGTSRRWIVTNSVSMMPDKNTACISFKEISNLDLRNPIGRGSNWDKLFLYLNTLTTKCLHPVISLNLCNFQFIPLNLAIPQSSSLRNSHHISQLSECTYRLWTSHSLTIFSSTVDFSL